MQTERTTKSHDMWKHKTPADDRPPI